MTISASLADRDLSQRLRRIGQFIVLADSAAVAIHWRNQHRQLHGFHPDDDYFIPARRAGLHGLHGAFILLRDWTVGFTATSVAERLTAGSEAFYGIEGGTIGEPWRLR